MAQPYMPLYCDALLGDIRVQGLIGPEKSAWIHLLVLLWQSDGRLKDDPAYIARLLQISRDDWLRLRQIYVESGLLRDFGGHLLNHRMDKELCKAEYLSNVRRESAKKMHEKRQKRKRKQ